jgi:REP element-mobilizing transposase RayT
MARKPRIEYPGAVYHVMARANRRPTIYEKDGDYLAFVKCLGEACERTGWKVHAYVVMGNHYHLLLETPEANLVAGMKWLQGTFTQRYNTAHRLSGHLFQGRYKALVLEPEEPEYFRIVSTYIHLNPIRARRVNLAAGERLSSYGWSSYPAYGKPLKRPGWLAVGRVLESLHLEDGMRGRRAYVEYMEERAQEAADKGRRKELEEEAKSIRRGWCLGDGQFRDRMLEKLEKTLAPRKRGSYHGAERAEHDVRMAERMIGTGLERAGLKVETLDELTYNDVRKVALAGWVKARTVASNGWLAERLKMGHEMNVSRAVKACRIPARRDLKRWLRKLEMLECAD